MTEHRPQAIARACQRHIDRIRVDLAELPRPYNLAQRRLVLVETMAHRHRHLTPGCLDLLHDAGGGPWCRRSAFRTRCRARTPGRRRPSLRDNWAARRSCRIGAMSGEGLSRIRVAASAGSSSAWRPNSSALGSTSTSATTSIVRSAIFDARNSVHQRRPNVPTPTWMTFLVKFKSFQDAVWRCRGYGSRCPTRFCRWSVALEVDGFHRFGRVWHVVVMAHPDRDAIARAHGHVGSTHDYGRPAFEQDPVFVAS